MHNYVDIRHATFGGKIPKRLKFWHSTGREKLTKQQNLRTGRKAIFYGLLSSKQLRWRQLSTQEYSGLHVATRIRDPENPAEKYDPLMPKSAKKSIFNGTPSQRKARYPLPERKIWHGNVTERKGHFIIGVANAKERSGLGGLQSSHPSSLAPFALIIGLHNIDYEACIIYATLVLKFYPSKEAKMRNCTVWIPRLPYSYVFIVATDEWERWSDYLSELSFVVSVTRSQETNDTDTYLDVKVSPRADAIEMQIIETIKALGQPMRHGGQKDEKEKICYSMYFWDTEIIRIYDAPGIDPPLLMSKIIDFLIESRSA